MHRGHPARPARQAYREHPEHQAHQAHQAHAEHQGHQAAAVRPVPSARGRQASSRRGERHREAYPRADSARRARSAHQAPQGRQGRQEAGACPPPPDPYPDHPDHPGPQIRPGPGRTRAGWAHSRPPGYRAHPGRKAEAEACSRVARPAFPEHSAEAAAAPLHHADDAEAAPPCWSRRPRCHRRSERAAARASPDRPEAAYQDRRPKTKTGTSPAKNPRTRTEPRGHPVRPRPAPAGSRTTNRPDRTAEPEQSAGSEESGRSERPVCSRPYPRHPAPCHPPRERRARGRPPSAEAGCRPTSAPSWRPARTSAAPARRRSRSAAARTRSREVTRNGRHRRRRWCPSPPTAWPRRERQARTTHRNPDPRAPPPVSRAARSPTRRPGSGAARDHRPAQHRPNRNRNQHQHQHQHQHVSRTRAPKRPRHFRNPRNRSRIQLPNRLPNRPPADPRSPACPPPPGATPAATAGTTSGSDPPVPRVPAPRRRGCPYGRTPPRTGG